MRAPQTLCSSVSNRGGLLLISQVRIGSSNATCDLRTFEAQPIRDTAEMHLWIQRMIASYEGWLTRLAA